MSEDAARMTLCARTCTRSSETRVTSVKLVSLLSRWNISFATFGKLSQDTFSVSTPMVGERLPQNPDGFIFQFTPLVLALFDNTNANKTETPWPMNTMIKQRWFWRRQRQKLRRYLHLLYLALFLNNTYTTNFEIPTYLDQWIQWPSKDDLGDGKDYGYSGNLNSWIVFHQLELKL